MMTAANVVFGIKRNELVKNPSDNRTRQPVTIPPSVVRTPLALLTAVRVNEPVTGIDWKNDPNKLHIPNASISCVESIVRPLAIRRRAREKKNKGKRCHFRSFQIEKEEWKLLTKCFGDSDTFKDWNQWQCKYGRAHMCDHIRKVECLAANCRLHWWQFKLRQSRSHFTYLSFDETRKLKYLTRK